MLEDALSYPVSGEQRLPRLAIGGLLFMFSWLILPALVAMGYLVRVLDDTSRGDDDEPPAFEEWGSLLGDGFRALLVALAYGLVPLIGLVVVFALLGGAGAVDGGAGVFAGLGVVALLLTLAVAFAIQYVLPAALTNFARERRLSAAFDAAALKPVLTSRPYVVAAVLVFVVAGILAPAFFFVFSTITFGLGGLLAPFFYFYVALVAHYLFGTAYADAVDVELTDEAGTAGPVVG